MTLLGYAGQGHPCRTGQRIGARQRGIRGLVPTHACLCVALPVSGKREILMVEVSPGSLLDPWLALLHITSFLVVITVVALAFLQLCFME